MECRTSLFIKPPAPQINGVSTPSSVGGWAQPAPSTPISPRNRSTYSTHRERYNPHHHQSTPIKKPVPVELIPLPIPKNHVMIALMEAAEQRQRAIIDENSDSDSDVEDYEDDNTVLTGIEALSSVCGTYVVRDNKGLAVFERNPHDLTLKKVPSYFTPPPMIHYGQRVQVVGMENDVYKLARNEGYLVADGTQLVKVGMPLEESCKVEGMISTIRSSKASLIKKLRDLEQAENTLTNDLNKILDTPPNHPVIEAFRCIQSLDLEEDALDEDDDDDDNNEEHILTDEDSILGEHLHRGTFEIGLSLSEESLIGTPTPSSPPPGTPVLSRQVLFLNDEETAISDSVSESGIVRRSKSPIFRGAFCGGSLFPHLLRSASDNNEVNTRRLQRYETTMLDDNNRNLDFRTGLSGHIALNIPKRKNTTLQKRRNEIRMMGEHRGIAPMRHIR